MPTDPLGPYVAQNGEGAVRLEADIGGGDYRRRRGFYRAAMLLLKAASEAATWQEGDPMVWPALTNFRHYVELTCKMLARHSGELAVSIPDRTHRLDLLWPPVQKKLIEALGKSWAEGFAVVDAAVALLNSIDPDGQSLRFAITTRGVPSLVQDVYLNADKLLKLAQSVEQVFGAAELALQAHLDFLNEFRESCR